MYTTALTRGTPRRKHCYSGGSLMSPRTDAAAAMKEIIDFWYGAQLLECPGLDGSIAARISTAMQEMGYEQAGDDGHWIKITVPAPRDPEADPQPVPAVPFPQPRRAADRAGVA